MKTCGTCKQEKEEIDFNAKGEGKLQSYCRDCEKEKKRKHYKDNKQYYIDKAMTRNKKLRSEFQDYKSTLSCIVCAESESVCLDFHHLDSASKDISIALAVVRLSKDKFQEELEKCVVLCSNCHRKLHANIIQLP